MVGGGLAGCPPAEKDVLEWFHSLSNWGRWGPDDQIGTLNLITPAVRRRAAQLVVEGTRVSCAWDMLNTPQEGDRYGPMQRFFLTTGEGLGDAHRVEVHHPLAGPSQSPRWARALEYVGFIFHGVNVTHIDALSHVFWDRKMYNGKPSELVSASAGATAHDIAAVRDGIFTRGVLIDIPAIRSIDWMEPGDGVFPGDLQAAEELLGLRVSEGDALLLRTGYGRRRREEGPTPRSVGQPGFHAAVLPWLRERGVSLIACDTANDVVPSGYTEITVPIHIIGIVSMGLWLVDNCDFERLASACAELRRWEFLFSLDPLRIAGGTGSPANPVATF